MGCKRIRRNPSIVFNCTWVLLCLDIFITRMLPTAMTATTLTPLKSERMLHFGHEVQSILTRILKGDIMTIWRHVTEQE